MAVTRARKTEIQLRRKQIAELYVQGWTQMAIAEKLNIGQPTVSLDLQKLQKEWRDSRIRDFDSVRELEIQKLDRLEREAWAAWERSQKPSQSAEFKDDASNIPSKKKVKNQNGDPRFLVVVHQCIASRRALLGLDMLPALPKEDTHDNSVERTDRIVSLVTAIRDRERAADARTIIIDQHPRDVRDGSERGQVEDGPPPGLPGPSDH
ncbi:MAG: hypothetical protein JWN70_2262 [Planctomycetaceae bacterium]|nr:hypothetical protein [Planctomycetaceae bacterium]